MSSKEKKRKSGSVASTNKPQDIDPKSTALRALRLLGDLRGTTDKREGVRTQGMPETRRIAEALIRSAQPVRANFEAAAAARGGEMTLPEAEGLAAKVVSEAASAMGALTGGAPAYTLRPTQLLALEAVVQVKERPAIRIVGNDLDDLSRYPEAASWRVIIDLHRRAIMTACGATAAVRATDLLAGSFNWVQGTAWLLSQNLAITNRHVLFPPMGGTRLARRVPGTLTARMRRDLEVSLDFAFHEQPPRQLTYRVTDILYVAAENDPVDAALLRVEPVNGAAPTLSLATVPQDDLERLYVVGHPGLMDSVPKDVAAVFGNPDAKKRVSFGQVMDVGPVEGEIIHDASTIGGYSGGCVLDFLAAGVSGLHYWGDTVKGNRAITATAIRAHPELSQHLP